jgi:NADH-ubiquinone oxidoreductase chain 2
MVLSAALDNGYVFLSFVAILTSVIGAVYYLNIIKEIFFYSSEYKINPLIKNLNLNGTIYNNSNKIIKSISFSSKNVKISSPMTITISIITLIILLFMFMNKE